MNHIAKQVEGRRYRSELRARQAETTRERILDAALHVMARGIATLSMPEVAREAGVSVPTVYRHFATKAELVDAIYPYLERRAGRGALQVPRTMADFHTGLLRVLDQLEGFDELARAAFASPAADESRRRSMPRRLAMFRGFVETLEPPLPERSLERIVRLIVVLTSTASLRMWRDHMGLPPGQVADEIEAAVTATIAAERGRAA
jgi:AcrR family transcriptional regulator